MALSATFTANFSSFYDAVDKAEAKLVDFGAGADKVAGKLGKLTDSFSGKSVIQQATLMAKAVEDIGGTVALTEKEMARLGSTVGEAVEKMKKLGMDVPANIQKIADETKGATKQTTDWVGALGKMAAAVGIAFSVGAVKSFIGSIFDAVDAISDMSAQWGISTDAVQKFIGAARQSGVEAATVGKSIQFLTEKLAGSNQEYDALLANVGLTGEALRKMPMELAYREVIAAIAGITDETLQLDVAIGLLGPSAKQMIGVIRDDFLKAADAQKLYSTATIDELKEAKRIWVEFGQTVTIESSKILAATTSTIRGITSSWSTFFSWAAKMGGGDYFGALQVVEGALHGVTTSTDGATDATVKLVSSHGAAAPKIKATGDVLQGLKDKQDAAKKTTEALADAQKAAAKISADVTKAHEAQAAAVRADQKALDDLAVTFSGRDLIGKAIQYLQAIERSIPIEKMSAEQKAAINKVMIAAIESYEQLGEVAPEAMMAVFLATRPVATEADQMRIAFMKANAELKAFIDTSGKLPPGLPGSTTLPDAPKAPGAGILDAPAQEFKKGIREMTEAFQRMADISEGAFGKIAQEIANTSAAMDTAAASGKVLRGGIADFKKGNITQGLAGTAAGAMGIVSSFQEATKSTNTLHTTMNGAAVGFSVAGPWGAAVGAAAGLIKGLFNQAKDRKELILMRDDFVKSAGGVKELAEQAKNAGMRIDDLFLARNTTDFKKAVEELNKAWAEQETNIQLVIDTAARYGITIDELGPTFKRQELDKQAQALYKDWELLNSAGLDTILISEKMASSVNDYIRNAARMGVEIPESMKPMLQTMIDNKQLVDDNGVAYEDLADTGITFTMSLTRGFQLLIAEVERLTDTITKSLTPSIENIPALPEPTEKQLHGLTDRQKDLWYPQTNVPKYAKGTNGFQNFGAGTMVELHGWEAVVPRDQPLASAAVLSAPMGGDGAAAPSIIINAQGAFFDTPDSLQRLASRVSEALTAKYTVMGKLRAAG